MLNQNPNRLQTFSVPRIVMIGTLAQFNGLIPADLAIWLSGLEDQLIAFFR